MKDALIVLAAAVLLAVRARGVKDFSTELGEDCGEAA
jgi:hypothetical protein